MRPSKTCCLQRLNERIASAGGLSYSCARHRRSPNFRGIVVFVVYAKYSPIKALTQTCANEELSGDKIVRHSVPKRSIWPLAFSRHCCPQSLRTEGEDSARCFRCATGAQKSRFLRCEFSENPPAKTGNVACPEPKRQTHVCSP